MGCGLGVRRVTDEQHRVKVDIFGQVYTLKGPGSPERLARVAALADRKMHELFEQNPRLNLQTLAILTALNFAEEYQRIANEYEALLQALEVDAGIRPAAGTADMQSAPT